jgi:3-hydroxyacyl-[acyl-carrier-protein] dehydratase
MSETQGAAMVPVDYDIRKILSALPHRYPMLLVDRVVAMAPGRSLHAVKAVSFNEGFFQGHFPGRPIMPGVLIVEALAQAAGILAIETLELAGSGKLVYFMAIEEAKFRALWSRACCSTCMWALSRSGRVSASSGARPCWATSWLRKSTSPP